jgi:O-antigen ligase
MSQSTSLEWPRRGASVATVPSADTGRVAITGFLGVYLVMNVLPITDVLITYVGIQIPVVVITGAILTAALPLVGQIGRFWTVPVSRPWITLSAVMCLAAVFGDYPGLSVPFIAEIAVRFHVLPFYCCAIALNPKRVRQLLTWIACGTVLLLVLCAAYGEMAEGRLGLPSTTLVNPNDLAFTILFGLPCLLLLFRSNSLFSRVLGFISVPAALLYILQTGSRGSFVTLVVLAGVMLTLLGGRGRLAMLTLGVVLGLSIMPVVPAETWTRLTLIVMDPLKTETEIQEDGLVLRAVTSQAARMELQKRAVALSFRNPFFGVGPLMFDNAVDQMVRQETGVKSTWQAAHNTYLSLAAENGLPALLLYVWSLGWCLRTNWSVYRRCQKIPSQAVNLPQTLCLILMTIGFCVDVLFSDMAYSAHASVLIGLSAANYLAIRQELEPAPAVVRADDPWAQRSLHGTPRLLRS